MIPKAETVEGIQLIDRMVTSWKRSERFPREIYFDLIVETALGSSNIERIAGASPRIDQMNIGQGISPSTWGSPASWT